MLFFTGYTHSREEIIIGVASSLTLLEGRESLEAVQLAVDEINSRGGLRVGGEKRLLRIEAVDLADASPKTSISHSLEQLERTMKPKTAITNQ